MFSGTRCSQPRWDSPRASVQPGQPCPRVRSVVSPVQSCFSCCPGAGRGSGVRRLLTAGCVVVGGLSRFYGVVLLWDFVPGTRPGTSLGKAKRFLVSSLCGGFSGRSCPSVGGRVLLWGGPAWWLCVSVLCSSDRCFLVAGQLWPLPTKGSPCRRR